MIFLFKLYFI